VFSGDAFPRMSRSVETLLDRDRFIIHHLDRQHQHLRRDSGTTKIGLFIDNRSLRLLTNWTCLGFVSMAILAVVDLFWIVCTLYPILFEARKL
jgi:hypothetical protein